MLQKSSLFSLVAFASLSSIAAGDAVAGSVGAVRLHGNPSFTQKFNQAIASFCTSFNHFSDITQTSTATGPSSISVVTVSTSCTVTTSPITFVFTNTTYSNAPTITSTLPTNTSFITTVVTGPTETATITASQVTITHTVTETDTEIASTTVTATSVSYPKQKRNIGPSTGPASSASTAVSSYTTSKIPSSAINTTALGQTGPCTIGGVVIGVADKQNAVCGTFSSICDTLVLPKTTTTIETVSGPTITSTVTVPAVCATQTPSVTTHVTTTDPPTTTILVFSTPPTVNSTITNTAPTSTETTTVTPAPSTNTVTTTTVTTSTTTATATAVVGPDNNCTSLPHLYHPNSPSGNVFQYRVYCGTNCAASAFRRSSLQPSFSVCLDVASANSDNVVNYDSSTGLCRSWFFNSIIGDDTFAARNGSSLACGIYYGLG